MDELAHVKLSGDIEGDYVVLKQSASGMLKIAPECPDGLPKVVALKKTCTACPSQWEGDLEDGRVVYARYRHGHLSVGVGNDLDAAVDNGMSDGALYAEYCGDGFDGYMDLKELKGHLYGLLEFPDSLDIEAEREPNWDPTALEELFRAPQDDDSTQEGD